jgi:hypothetical protein
MGRVKVSAKLKKNLTLERKREVKDAVKSSLRVIAQDIARTSSETAPHLTGDLEDSYSIGYFWEGDSMSTTVEYSAYNGDFNYAIAMHEWVYQLGEGSQAKAGGTGMSGTSYAVGRKYLERVLEGESEAYKDYIAKKINEVLE